MIPVMMRMWMPHGGAGAETPEVDYGICGKAATTLLYLDGPDASTTITDYGTAGGVWSFVNSGGEIDAAQYPSGMTSSLWLPGWRTGIGGESVRAVANSDQDILDLVEFTVEAWVYLYDAPPAAGHVIVSKWYDIYGGWEFRINAARNLSFAFPYQSAGITGGGVLPIGQWAHVCATRTAKATSNGMHLGVDGTIYSGASFNHSANEPALSQLRVGAGFESEVTRNSWHGWISSVRITRGCARYRADILGDPYYYTVPTLPLPIPD